MKQVIQIYRTGELKVVEAPAPLVTSGNILVRTAASLISAGTEKSGLALARKSLLSKARSRPDLVRKVIDTARNEGITEAYRQSRARLDTPVALGYSSAGTVIEVGERTPGFRPGDRVACFGAGFASHAEIVRIPRNLAVPVPDALSLEEAAFVGLGAIALHGTRLLGLALGESGAVIGLGMLGIISAQLLAAGGCRVAAFDPDGERVRLGRELGLAAFSDEDDFVAALRDISGGQGADGAVIWAAGGENEPLELAAAVARRQGRVAAPGLVGLEIPRELFYEKELDFVVPRSAGPGIYDPDYELKGRDYPPGYVRWSARRNMAEFLRLAAEKKIRVGDLITHRFPLPEAESAYELIGGGGKSYLGVILTGEENPAAERVVPLSPPSRSPNRENVRVGLIGAGLFAKGTLLPAIQGMKGIVLRGVATASGASGRATGEKFNFRYCATDYREILADDEIDCVLIATRHNLHAGLVLDVLASGKAVFVEKPLCLTPEELKKIEQAVTETGLPLMVGYNRRFSPHSRKLRRFLAQKPGPWVVSLRCNAGFVPAASWVQDPEEGAGRVLGEVGHFVDLAHFLADGLSEQVYARAAGMAGGEFFNEDNLVITLSLGGGSTAVITYTAAGPRSYPRERVEIFGSGCAGEIDNFKASRFITAKKARRHSRPTVDRGHREEFAAFFQAVRTGSAPVSWADYRATTLATFAIEESLREGKPCRLSP